MTTTVRLTPTDGHVDKGTVRRAAGRRELRATTAVDAATKAFAGPKGYRSTPLLEARLPAVLTTK